MMERQLEQAYKAELSSTTNLCCEMGTVGVLEVCSPERFTKRKLGVA